MTSILRRTGASASLSSAMVASIATGVAGQFVLVASGVVVARALGPENRGVLAIVVLLSGLAAQVGSLGAPLSITYLIAAEKSNARSLLRGLSGFRMLQLASALSFQTVLILVVLPPRSPSGFLWVALLSLLATAAALSQMYGLAALQGLRRFRAFNVLRTLSGALYAVGAVGLWAMHRATLTSITLVVIGASVIAAGATSLVLLRTVPLADDSRSVPTRRIVSFGLRSLFGSAPPVEAFRLDQLAVGLALPPIVLGYYFVALAFTNLSRFIGQSIGMVTYPKVAAAEKGAQLRILRRDFVLGVVITGSATVVLITLVPWLLPFFFGSAFESATTAAQILLVGTFFASIRRILVDGTRGLGLPLWGAVAESSTLLALPVVLVVAHYTRSLPSVALVLAGSNLVALLALTPALFSIKYRPSRPFEKPSNTAGGRSPSSLSDLNAGGDGAEQAWFPSVRAGSASVTRDAWYRIARLLHVHRRVRLEPLCIAAVVATSLAGGVLVVSSPTSATIVVIGLALAIFLTRATRGRLMRLARRPQVRMDGVADKAGPSPARAARLFYYAGMLTLGELIIRPALSLTLSDWFFFIALAFAAAHVALHGAERHRLGTPLVFAGLGLFAVGGMLSSFASSSPAGSIAIVLRVVYLIGVWFWLGSYVLRTPKHVQLAMRLWLVSAALSASGAILQLLYGDVIPGSMVAWGRMSGLTGHVNDLGALCGIALGPVVALLVAGDSPRRLKVLDLVTLSLLVLGLFLSGSVGGMIAGVVGAVVASLLSRRFVRVAVALLIAVAVAAALGLHQGATSPISPLHRITTVSGNSNDPNATIWSRVETYRLAWSRIDRDPLVGVGLDVPSSTTDSGSQVHNLILGAWYETGLIGLAGITIILLALARTAGAAIRGSTGTPRQTLVSGLVAAMMASLAFSMGAPILYQRYFWVGPALVLALGPFSAVGARSDLRIPRVRAPTSASDSGART